MARSIPDPSVNVFFAGVPSDLAVIEAILATMPMCVYGQVVIESDEPLDALELPRRVQLRRVAPVTAVGGERISGEAIARAADAWLEEWMPDQAAATPRTFFAWIGCDGSIAAADAGHRVGHSLRAGLTGN